MKYNNIIKKVQLRMFPFVCILLLLFGVTSYVDLPAYIQAFET